MKHIANWLKINYRGRALLACLIGLVILWSKVSLVTDVIYIVAFKDYSKLEKYGVEVTYAEEPEEEPIGIINGDVAVYDDNVAVDGLDSLLVPPSLGSNWDVYGVIIIKARRGKQ